jgi:hypothetical protein
MMEALITSETPVNFYETIRCNNPEDSQLHTRRRENLKSHLEPRPAIGLPVFLLRIDPVQLIAFDKQ